MVNMIAGPWRRANRLDASGAPFEDKMEVGQQLGCVDAARRDVKGLLPALAATAVDEQRWSTAVLAWIDDPVFANGGHSEVEFDVAVKILFSGVVRNNLYRNDRRKVPPIHIALREVYRKISVRDQVRLRRGDTFLQIRYENSAGSKDLINYAGMLLDIALKQSAEPSEESFVREIGERRHVKSPMNDLIAISFLVFGRLELFEAQASAVVALGQI
jgi:hypothetical protein